jgi:hypothetical protein
LRSLRAENVELKRELRDAGARLASIESDVATLHGDRTRRRRKIDRLVARPYPWIE